MPNVATTIYLSDDVYEQKFLPRKKEILAKMRNYIRKELGIAEVNKNKKND